MTGAGTKKPDATWHIYAGSNVPWLVTVPEMIQFLYKSYRDQNRTGRSVFSWLAMVLKNA